MSYRAPIGIASPGRVVHGPFPIRLGPLVAGVVLLPIAPLLVAMAFDDAKLTCDRKKDRCDYDASPYSARRERFALSAIRDVRVEIEAGSKNSRHGVPYLDLGDRQLRLASQSVDDAERFEERLERAIEDKDARIELDLPASRWITIPGVLLLVAALSGLRTAFRGIGRVVIESEGGALQLTRSVFGVPLWRRRVELHGTTDVEIDWERSNTFWTPKHSPGEPYGQLVLVKGATREALTPTRFPGFHIHRRAERELRTLLGFPPRPEPAEHPMAPTPLMGGGIGATIGLTWLGLCVGAMLGVPIVWVVAILAGVAESKSAPDWVVPLGMALGALGGVASAFALRRRAMTR
jgi:hypothetical protein